MSTRAACFAACDDTLTYPAAELDKRFIKGRDGGFSVDIVQDYVATLTDTSVQPRLRDPKRNGSFSKVALNNRDGEEFIKATSGCVARTTCSLSKTPGACCPRSVLYCTTHTGGSNSAERNTRTHAHVHERSYTHLARPDPLLPGLTLSVHLRGPPVSR